MSPESILTCPETTPVRPAANNGKAASNGLDELNRSGRKIDELLERAQALPDPAARALARECVESLLAFQGKGLARILEVVREAGPAGEEVLDELTHDAAVSGLLLIHGLHPLDQETRLRHALDKVRPHMERHGGNIELLGLNADVARLQFKGACNGCPSSAITMELAVRQAVEEACPDLRAIEVEGIPSPTPAPA